MLIPPEIRDSVEFDYTQEEAETFYRIVESFLDNFKENDGPVEFLFAFCSMAFDVCKLHVNDVFVDVSRKKRFVDINLTLDEGLFLSVAKEVDNKTDVIMYSVAINHETLSLGEAPIKDVVEKTKQVLKELKETNDRLG